MDRHEAMLRELHLYPQWVLREGGAEGSGHPAASSLRGRRSRPAPAAAQIGATVPAAGVAPAPLASPSTRHSAPAETEMPARAGNNNIQTGLAVAAQAIRPGGLGWAELKQRVRDCTACRLRAGCAQTVFGVGDEKADWLFVGEGPGADEDALGEPFVGQAGKLLDSMLMSIKLKRGQGVYIANVVKCRPPGNRNPEADEIAQCLPYLQRQIELIRPRMIVALGKVASNALLGKDATLASLRGKPHDYRVATAAGLDGIEAGENSHLSSIPHQATSSHRDRVTIPLIVTYHPAYLLRSPSEKAKAWQDLCLALKVMADKKA